MFEKKIMVVFGATGIQGGSVVKSILGDPVLAGQFAIRAVTRDLSKPESQALLALGAEIVSANFDDKSSLLAAFKGAYGVYLVTNFWATMNKETEITQGKNVADVAKVSNIKHLIFSSLPSATTLSNGTLNNVYHFDSKAIIETYIRELSIPATFLMPGFYMNNLPGQRFALSSSTNTWTLSLPIPSNTRLPLFAAEFDTGKFVTSILSNPSPSSLFGTRIYAATAYMTPTEILEVFKECFPEAARKAKVVEMTNEEFKGLLEMYGMPKVGRQDLGEMMQLFARFGYFGGEGLEESMAMVKEPLTSWKEYALKTAAFKGLM